MALSIASAGSPMAALIATLSMSAAAVSAQTPFYVPSRAEVQGRPAA